GDAGRRGGRPARRGEPRAPPTPRRADERTRAPRLDGLELAKPAARHGGEDRLPARALVVPGEGHLPHEVRIRGLEALVTLEDLGQSHDAALAADAADLDRLRTSHAGTLVLATRSAHTACRSPSRPTSS